LKRARRTGGCGYAEKRKMNAKREKAQTGLRAEIAAGGGVRMREATAEDGPRVIALVNAAYAVEDFLEGTRTDPERLAATMAKGTVLVAEVEGGGLVGTVYYEARGERGYMGMLAVEPARQGEGLASMMVREAEDRLRAAGCRAVDITVLSLRPELLPIYRRFGFVETGTEPFAYGRVFKEPMECHCIRMAKEL